MAIILSLDDVYEYAEYKKGGFAVNKLDGSKIGDVESIYLEKVLPDSYDISGKKIITIVNGLPLNEYIQMNGLADEFK